MCIFVTFVSLRNNRAGRGWRFEAVGAAFLRGLEAFQWDFGGSYLLNQRSVRFSRYAISNLKIKCIPNSGFSTIGRYKFGTTDQKSCHAIQNKQKNTYLTARIPLPVGNRFEK